MSDSPTITPEQRAAEREVHAGAQGGGVKIAGLAEVTEYKDSFAGSKAEPVLIGQTITVQVRVAEDGTLLPRRENSDESTPPATSILTIDVIPSVEFDSSSDSHVIYTGYARQTDVATSRVFATSRSGPTDQEEAALAGDRPATEYGNDPAYKDGMLALHATSREEAVAQALGSVVSSGRMNEGLLDPPPETKPSRKRVGVVVGGVAIATGTAIGIVATGGDDPAPPVDPDPVVVEDAGTAADDSTDGTDTALEDVADDSDDSSDDSAPVDDGPEEDTPSDAEVDPDAPALMAGFYEWTGTVDGDCGSYPVYLDARFFVNGQGEVDQLLSEGGQPFQTAAGYWTSAGAVVTLDQPDLFEIWVIVPQDDGLFTILNAYGSGADNLPVTETDHTHMLTQFDLLALAEDIDGLGTHVGGHEDTCSNWLGNVPGSFADFP